MTMEPLGAAASVISVVSLVIQLVENIQQLHDFWHSFKHALAEAHKIVDDLDSFCDVVNSGFRSLAGTNPVLLKIFQCCDNRIGDLREVVEKQESGFASKRHVIRQWSSFKAVSKKKEIDSFQSVIRGTKLDLLLINQILAE